MLHSQLCHLNWHWKRDNIRSKAFSPVTVVFSLDWKKHLTFLIHRYQGKLRKKRKSWSVQSVFMHKLTTLGNSMDSLIAGHRISAYLGLSNYHFQLRKSNSPSANASVGVYHEPPSNTLNSAGNSGYPLWGAASHILLFSAKILTRLNNQ